MKRVFLSLVLVQLGLFAFSQEGMVKQNETPPDNFTIDKLVAATPVKNQAATGTCWCFSTTSLLESQCIKKGLGQLDLSEMFTVRNIYIEKARNYILRQGHAQFGEGGLGHDLIRAIATYGAVPESEYSGLKNKQKMHNHVDLVVSLQRYLDSVLKIRPLPLNWIDNYIQILDLALGTPPADFMYQGKKYTPKSFATEVLKFDPNEYVNITSFTHHPYYAPFIIEVPDNFSNGAYYNLPLEEMLQVTKDALKNGYSILWDADVSNTGFRQKTGIAMNFDSSIKPVIKGNLRQARQDQLKQQKKNKIPETVLNQNKDNPKFIDSVENAMRNPLPTTNPVAEAKWDADTRQALYENLTTQDDHLMHITGLERAGDGKTYFLVKNSWGDIGPAHGYINVSEGYFAVNTISLIIPKAGLSKELLAKLGIK